MMWFVDEEFGGRTVGEDVGDCGEFYALQKGAYGQIYVLQTRAVSTATKPEPSVMPLWTAGGNTQCVVELAAPGTLDTTTCVTLGQRRTNGSPATWPPRSRE